MKYLVLTFVILVMFVSGMLLAFVLLSRPAATTGENTGTDDETVTGMDDFSSDNVGEDLAGENVFTSGGLGGAPKCSQGIYDDFNLSSARDSFGYSNSKTDLQKWTITTTDLSSVTSSNQKMMFISTPRGNGIPNRGASRIAFPGNIRGDFELSFTVDASRMTRDGWSSMHVMIMTSPGVNSDSYTLNLARYGQGSFSADMTRWVGSKKTMFDSAGKSAANLPATSVGFFQEAVITLSRKAKVLSTSIKVGNTTTVIGIDRNMAQTDVGILTAVHAVDGVRPLVVYLDNYAFKGCRV